MLSSKNEGDISLQADELAFPFGLRIGSESQASKKSAVGTVVSIRRKDSACGGLLGGVQAALASESYCSAQGM